MMLLRLLTWPYLRKHLLRWSLTLAGIVLGVAVFVAMHTANRSVFSAFDKTIDQIAGATQLQVTAGTFGFDESILERVQAVPEVGVAVPVIEATVETKLPGQGSVLVLGTDMTSDRNLRDYELKDADEAIIDDPLVFLAQPDSVMITREFAARNHLQVNDKLPLVTVAGEKQFTVRGIMSSAGMTRAFGGNLAIMDIYAAQHELSRGHRFDRIDVRAKDGVTVDECQAALKAALGPGMEVEPPSARGRQFESLLVSYSKALIFSSLFALVVGLFIIYNSFAIAVTHRRSEIGILRALGATRRQIQQLFFLESLAAGLLGSTIGAGVGIFMAWVIASYLSNTMSDVTGYSQVVTQLDVDPKLVAAGIVIGTVTSIIAAWIPARNAARVDPVKALQKGRYQVLSEGENRRRRWIAVALCLISVGCLFLSYSRLFFYTGYLSITAACLLFAPALTLVLSKALRPLLKAAFPAIGTLAADSLVQAPRRTSATVSALMLSLAMVVAFGGFTHSFYSSLDEWMTTALNPDFYVSSSSNLRQNVTFPSSIEGLIEGVPGVAQVQLVRNARVMFRGLPVMVIAIETEKAHQTVHRIPTAGTVDEMDALSAEGKGLIASDSFAQIHHLHLHDAVSLPSPAGILTLPIAGIVRDYSDMQGSLFIDRTVYKKWWNDDTANAARVYVKKGENAPEVHQRIVNALAGGQHLLVLTNEEVRLWIMKLLDNWFALTYNQIAVAILVAILGIINTLTVSITDRRRELGVMQAVGGLRNQIRHTIWIEALSIGVIGLILGTGLGAINLYYLLGILKRDLGGVDLDYIFPVTFMLLMIPMILVSAFAAAIGPAESAVRGTLVEALEYE
ncbi:MAG TPA: FtsX-like permease family protein [Terriglobia bacterium]|nr:FtsX-like permease family protein [Terriglobia bacterium]